MGLACPFCRSEETRKIEKDVYECQSCKTVFRGEDAAEAIFRELIREMADWYERTKEYDDI
jgi:ribosomal protein L37AE/L43A